MGIPEDFPLWDFGNRIVRKLMRRLFFFFFFFHFFSTGRRGRLLAAHLPQFEL